MINTRTILLFSSRLIVDNASYLLSKGKEKLWNNYYTTIVIDKYYNSTCVLAIYLGEEKRNPGTNLTKVV